MYRYGLPVCGCEGCFHMLVVYDFLFLHSIRRLYCLHHHFVIGKHLISDRSVLCHFIFDDIVVVFHLPNKLLPSFDCVHKVLVFVSVSVGSYCAHYEHSYDNVNQWREFYYQFFYRVFEVGYFRFLRFERVFCGSVLLRFFQLYAREIISVVYLYVHIYFVKIFCISICIILRFLLFICSIKILQNVIFMCTFPPQSQSTILLYNFIFYPFVLLACKSDYLLKTFIYYILSVQYAYFIIRNKNVYDFQKLSSILNFQVYCRFYSHFYDLPRFYPVFFLKNGWQLVDVSKYDILFSRTFSKYMFDIVSYF